MTPRPYQQRAHRALGAAVVAGKKRILLVSPTGSGKTCMLSRVNHDADKRGKRCLWLVPRHELVGQTVRTLAQFGVTAGHLGLNASAPTQILTYQGALARGEVPPADIVFADEAHHLAEKGQWIDILKAYPDAHVIGASATPERGDGHALDLFESLIVVAQPGELVAEWERSGGTSGLVPCELLRPSRPIFDGVARTPAKATVLHKLRDHQQVVFAPHLLAAEEYAAGFREIGSSVAIVTGKTPRDERAQMLAEFRARKIRVLVNVHVLTEGFDAPEVEVVTLGRKFRTIGAMIQAVGRGARPSPGKTRFYCLDLTGCTHVLGHPFADREYSLEGEGIRGKGAERVIVRVCKRCTREMAEDETVCAECGWTRPPPETPKETGDKLERWAFLQGDDTDKRVERLTRWIRDHKEPGSRKAVASAICRYTAVYGTPPSAIVGHAAANAAGRAWCATCQHSIRETGCRCPKVA